MKFFIYILTFYLVSCALSCGIKETGALKDRKIIDRKDSIVIEKLTRESIDNLWFIKFRESVKDNIWKLKKDSIVSFKYVDSWLLVPTNDYLFYAELDSLDENSFVVTLKLSKKEVGLEDLEMYFKEVNRQLGVDSIEILKRSNFYLVTKAEKNRTIYGEIMTTINTVNYKVLTCYIEDRDNVYDFSMKLPQDKFNEISYSAFCEYINNFTYLNMHLAPSLKSIGEIEEIRIN